MTLESTKSESFYHKTIKQLFYENVTERNKAIPEKSLEIYGRPLILNSLSELNKKKKF